MLFRSTRPITEADFATMNIGRTNKKLREELLGKDLNDPAQVQEVRDVLENWVQKGRSEPINKGVAKFLDAIPKPLQEQEQGKLGLRRPYGSVKKAKPEAAMTAEEQDLLRQELEDEGWVQYQGNKPLKNEMDELLQCDTDLISLEDKIEYFKTMIYTLEQIIRSLNSRTWDIKSGIEWSKFTNGMM